MKVGDLVAFNPKKPFPGALTAVKYLERMRKKINGLHGIIISKHDDNYRVMFGDKILILNKDYLEVING